MKTRRWLAVLATGVMVATMPPAFAKTPEGCQFLGSWFGVHSAGYAYFTSNAIGSSNSEGTYVLDVVIDSATLNYFFPGAVDQTKYTGTWRRIDDYNFELSVIALAFDVNRQVLGIAKIRGIDTLDDTCNKMSIVTYLDLYDADANPFVDDPYFSMPLTPHFAYRMSIP